MERVNIIILTKGDQVETWGSLTDLCDNHESFSYHYLKKKKFPFYYKGFRFERVPFRKKLIN